MTDHRSLQKWSHENLDTPSGPRGRKARWHETLSQFRLEVKYIPGRENIIADAMSRFAYPASSAREYVSFHGSLKAKEEILAMAKREEEEDEEERSRRRKSVASDIIPEETGGEAFPSSISDRELPTPRTSEGREEGSKEGVSNRPESRPRGSPAGSLG